MAGKKGGKSLNKPIYCITILTTAVISLTAAAQEQAKPTFVGSDKCISCHSNMVDSLGNVQSIGHAWRASMMALSAKDPYWQAAVRREIADRPHLQKEIEDICSVCHMPMFRTTAVANGGSGEIIRYVKGGFTPEEQVLGEDGVSCTVCHQISAENFGEHGSFDGGYVITPSLSEQGKVFGPYEVDAGLQRVMHSASAKLPGEGAHIQQSELCATCHTLFTPAVDGNGTVIGEFPEQVPYLEWKHSAFVYTNTCQDCHMPEVPVPTPITSVLGEPRDNVSKHAFRGGNVFMLKLFNKYRDDLNVTTPAHELEQSAQANLEHLQSSSANLEIASIEIAHSETVIEISVQNKAGHKLPTAYPSRRAWLHVTVRAPNGNTLFESGALNPDGSIVGNDNDMDPSAYEPHYVEISNEDQVQIYEPIILDYKNEVTTSLLASATLAKDNRLLPKGFDKATADEAVRVHGAAVDDDNFQAEGDLIRYRVGLPDDVDAVQVSAQLMYQTIGYRWAHNLEAYNSHETNRFVGYFKANADVSAIILAKAVNN